jgi:prepilin-type N-terminal cleavage/methylation domain-containing protein
MRSRSSLFARRAFTLVELLAVIAIVGLFAALIVGVVGRARQNALKVTAIADLRRVGIGLLSFVQDNRQTLPGPAPLGINSVYNRNSGVSELAVVLAPYLEYPQRLDLPTGQTAIIQPLVCPGFLQHQPEISTSYPHYVQNYTLSRVPGGRIFGRYAFGSSVAIPGLTLSQIDDLGGPARVWALTNLDQRVSRDHPGMASNSITSSGWFGNLPETPVWGNSRLRVYLDAHVASVAYNAAF